MTAREKMALSSSIMRQNNWTQQTLLEMNFSPRDTPQRAHRQKRSIDDVQLTAGKIQPRIQLTLSKAGKLERGSIQTQPRENGTKKKSKADNKQVTLLEKWNIQANAVQVSGTKHESRKGQTKNTCT